jgi:hypothetical protein
MSRWSLSILDQISVYISIAELCMSSGFDAAIPRSARSIPPSAKTLRISKSFSDRRQGEVDSSTFSLTRCEWKGFLNTSNARNFSQVRWITQSQPLAGTSTKDARQIVREKDYRRPEKRSGHEDMPELSENGRPRAPAILGFFTMNVSLWTHYFATAPFRCLPFNFHFLLMIYIRQYVERNSAPCQCFISFVYSFPATYSCEPFFLVYIYYVLKLTCPSDSPPIWNGTELALVVNKSIYDCHRPQEVRLPAHVHPH